MNISSICFAIGVMLLAAAAGSLYISILDILAIRPVYDYVDDGVYTFVPAEFYPIQVNNNATGRQKRNHPTKTVYVVSYHAKGSYYKYKYHSGSVESTARRILEEGATVERRVLRVPKENVYITVGAHETAESHAAGEKKKYLVIAACSSIYLIAFAGFWLSS